jgi:2-dehydropantoate 2-reductase
MKIVIIGAGAMGCRFGTHFQKGGAEVVLVDVWKEHVDAINERGLTIAEEDGSVENVRLTAVADVRDAGLADVIVLLTKATQTEEALKNALQIMSDDTSVLSVQNGLGNFDIIEKIVGKDRMIIGCTLTPTTAVGPGEIRVDGYAHSDVQALGTGSVAACEEICAILRRGGMSMNISENVLKEIWQKLSFNAAMNPITGITKLVVADTGALGAETAAWIADEVAAVARAEGVDIDTEFALNLFRSATAPDGDRTHLTSMLQDVVRSKPTEAESICGAVIDRAKTHGIPVPHLETVCNLIKIIQSNYNNQLESESF